MKQLQHQAMFERCFERLYKEYCETGMPPHHAREMAADDAWTQYQHELELIAAADEKTWERLELELKAIAGALGIGSKRSQ